MQSHTCTTTALCLLLAIGLATKPTRAASIKDISTAYLAPLSSLLLFGGYNASSATSQYVTTAGLLSLATAFSTDSPPITQLDPLPLPTSRLVPVITPTRGGASGNRFDVHLSNGVMNGQLGNRTFTYTVTANGSAAPIVQLQSKVIEGNVEVPFAPAYVAAASTRMDAMDGGVNWAVGGRYYPEGPFLDKMWVFAKNGPPSLMPPNPTQPNPSPRADAALVPLNATHLLLSGGYTTNASTTHSDMWTYSIASKSWLKYPHTTTRPRSHHALVVYKRKWVVSIGREAPLVEVVEWGGKPRVAVVKGVGPEGLETTAAVVVGAQIVLVGGLTASKEKDERLVRVLKILETRDGSGTEALAFEWSNTFTPPPASDTVSGTPISPDPSSPFPIGAVVGTTIGCSLLLALGAFALISRRRRRRLQKPVADAESNSTNEPVADPKLTSTLGSTLILAPPPPTAQPPGGAVEHDMPATAYQPGVPPHAHLVPMAAASGSEHDIELLLPPVVPAAMGGNVARVVDVRTGRPGETTLYIPEGSLER